MLLESVSKMSEERGLGYIWPRARSPDHDSAEQDTDTHRHTQHTHTYAHIHPHTSTIALEQKLSTFKALVSRQKAVRGSLASRFAHLLTSE